MGNNKSAKRTDPAEMQAKRSAKRKAKKKKFLIRIFIAAAFCAAVAAAFIVFSVISSLRISEFTSCTWVPHSAENASGDEVELSSVYDTDYSSFEGSLTFRDDGSFSLWLSAGNPDDGTHTGTYSVRDSENVELYFDDGTVTDISVERSDGAVRRLSLNYNDYTVYFVKQ